MQGPGAGYWLHTKQALGFPSPHARAPLLTLASVNKMSILYGFSRLEDLNLVYTFSKSAEERYPWANLFLVVDICPAERFADTFAVGATCGCIVHISGPVWVHTHRSPPELEAKKPLAWPTMTDNFGADIFSNLICLELRWWVVVVDLYDAARDFSGHFQGKAGGEIHGKQAEAEYPLLWTIGQLNDFFAVRVSAQERKETSWSPPTLLRSR